MPSGTLYTEREYRGETDLHAVCDLLNLCDKVYNFDDSYDPEDLRLEFEHPKLDQARDLRLWHDESGRLVGFGQLWIDKDKPGLVDAYIYFRIHPEDQNHDLADQISGWGRERMGQVARESDAKLKLIGSNRDHYAFGREVLEKQGYKPVRYFFRMARPLDVPIAEPQFPPGFELSYVKNAEQVPAWVEVFNQSFIDHWNHHPETVEDRLHSIKGNSYLAERDLVAVAPDGRFAAFCFCLIDPGEISRSGRNAGWIELLGTGRNYRQMGLGKAMLLAGLHRLKADGVDTAMLGVDADNPTGALGLYEAVGFQRLYSSTSYELAP